MHWWSHSGLCLLWYLLLVSVLSWMSSSCLIFTTLPNQNSLYCISSMALRYLLSFVTLHKAVQLLCRHLVCFHEFVLAWIGREGRRVRGDTDSGSQDKVSWGCCALISHAGGLQGGWKHSQEREDWRWGNPRLTSALALLQSFLLSDKLLLGVELRGLQETTS